MSKAGERFSKVAINACLDEVERLRAENAELVAAANKLADQVDHCLLGYAVSLQNGLSIKDDMLSLRVVCNEYMAAADAATEDKSDD